VHLRAIRLARASARFVANWMSTFRNQKGCLDVVTCGRSSALSGPSDLDQGRPGPGPVVPGRAEYSCCAEKV